MATTGKSKPPTKKVIATAKELAKSLKRKAVIEAAKADLSPQNRQHYEKVRAAKNKPNSIAVAPKVALSAEREQQLAEWERLSKAMDRTRKATARSFNGSRWRQDARVGDTLHAFAFAFAGCFMGALRFELQRDWPRPRLAPGPHAATLAAAMSKHLQEAGDASAVLSLGTDDESTHRLRRALAALGPVEKGLVRAFPQTHWLHKMGYHLHIALGVDLTSREWRENRTALPQLGYLAEGTRIMIANDCHRVALLTIADCAPRQAPSARTRAARTVT